MIDLQFTLNGATVSLRTPPERRLLDILREDMQLTGAKPGCGIGRCGACMVWLDSIPANSCLLMAFQLQDRAVSTIEAVAHLPESASVREALARCGGVQCGYCSAGLVMTLTHLHGRQPRPDAAGAAALAAGNLCRCTGYGGIRRALDELFPAA
jgi:carbon-monoxide dehydrogenase small subunit